MSKMSKLVDHYDVSVYVKHPEQYVCCVGCKGKRTKRIDLYSRHQEEIRNYQPGRAATLGAVYHNLIAAWRNVPCNDCNGIGYWKPQ